MYLLRRILYYLRALIALPLGIRNWWVLFALIRPLQHPVLLVLRDGTQYRVRSLMDAWIIKETNIDRDYEKYGVPIEDGWNIVDIGAGLGDFAIFAARQAPRGHVYAYEPAPDSVVLLQQNLAINELSNVAVFPYAVADKAGVLNLDLSGGVAVQYSTVDSKTGPTNWVEVESVALADAVALPSGGKCDLLKIDAEGAEYDMLLNLDEESLRNIRRICIEYHEFVTPFSHVDLERHFQAKGWDVRVTPSRVRKDLGFLYAARRGA